jgi:hypothetical protein
LLRVRSTAGRPGAHLARLKHMSIFCRNLPAPPACREVGTFAAGGGAGSIAPLLLDAFLKAFRCLTRALAADAVRLKQAPAGSGRGPLRRGGDDHGAATAPALRRTGRRRPRDRRARATAATTSRAPPVAPSPNSAPVRDGTYPTTPCPTGPCRYLPAGGSQPPTGPRCHTGRRPKAQPTANPANPTPQPATAAGATAGAARHRPPHDEAGKGPPRPHRRPADKRCRRRSRAARRPGPAHRPPWRRTPQTGDTGGLGVPARTGPAVVRAPSGRAVTPGRSRPAHPDGAEPTPGTWPSPDRPSDSRDRPRTT